MPASDRSRSAVRSGPAGLWRLAVPVVCLVAGALFGTSAMVAQGTDLRPGPRDLSDLIRERNLETRDRTRQVQQLQAEVDALTEQAAPGNVTVTQLQDRSAQLAPVVGTGPVAGPALQVTLDDAGYTAENLPEGYTVDDVVVHQQDVQAVVNAMWAGGAEAMMLQDQRVISTSAVRCVGNTLFLQGRVYSPPYRVTAIGDIQGMQQALDADATVQIYRDYVDLIGLGYRTEQLGEQEFPGFAGSLSLEYATVVD